MIIARVLSRVKSVERERRVEASPVSIGVFRQNVGIQRLDVWLSPAKVHLRQQMDNRRQEDGGVAINVHLGRFRHDIPHSLSERELMHFSRVSQRVARIVILPERTRQLPNRVREARLDGHVRNGVEVSGFSEECSR